MSRPLAIGSAPVDRATIRRTAAGVAAILAVVAMAASCGSDASPGGGVSTTTGRPAALSPAGSGLTYLEDVTREQNLVGLLADDVTGTRNGDVSGQYVNVHDGIRATTPPPPCADCPHLEVWFTGGSAAFGLWQRDDHTIASELVARAAQEGISLAVSNLSTPGWTVEQEALDVFDRLRDPRARPDVVVFYDGFNDVVLTWAQAVRAPVDWEMRPVYDQPAMEHLLADPDRARRTVLDNGGAQAFGDRIGQRLEAQRADIRARLRELGVSPVFVFQADGVSGPDQRRFTSGSSAFSTKLATDLSDILQATSGALSTRDERFRNLFAGDTHPSFFDPVHNTEEGSAVIAAALLDELRPSVAR